MKSRLLLQILFLLAILSGCSHKDLQISRLTKQISDIKSVLQYEIKINSGKIEAINMCCGHKEAQNNVKTDREINEIAEPFCNPIDSGFYFDYSSAKIKDLFDSTVNGMQKILFKFTGPGQNKKTKDYLTQYSITPTFYELSSDKQTRVFNIICNQINVLSYQRKLQGYLEAFLPEMDINCTPSLSVFDNNKIKKGEKYIAKMCLTNKQAFVKSKELELVKLTLNGKSIHPKIELSEIDSINTFSFLPDKPGIYEWTVNYYSRYPDGTMRIFPYHGKLEVKE